MSTREAIRSQKRVLTKENRSLERQIRNNKREEEKIQSEIKAAAKKGDMTTVKILAKQLVQFRKQEERMKKLGGNLKAMEFKVAQQGSQVTMTNTMKTMNQVLGGMNKQMDTKDLQNILRQYSKESDKMEMKEEMLDSALDDMFDDEDLEDEVDSAMQSVLDEIGLETKSKLGNINISKKSLEVEVSDEEDQDLMKRLSKLRG